MHSKPDGWARTRWEDHEKRTGKPPSLPRLDAGAYLFAAFLEAGKVSVTYGAGPLTWAEIDAYSRQTGEISTPFEARTLRRMSEAYLGGKTAGEDPLSIEPEV